MRRSILGITTLLLSCMSIAPAFAAEEKTPEPLQQPAPPLGMYLHCVAPDAIPEDGYVGSVDVAYGLTRTGRTIDLEVSSSTDPCLEDSATKMVGLWIYNPRSIPKPKRGAPLQMNATLKYQLFDENEANKEEYLIRLREAIIVRRKTGNDAVPERRKPPALNDFRDCIRSADFRLERVVVAFDVSPEGKPVNTRILGSSSKCFEKAAIRSVERWTYAPRMIDGKPAAHTDITSSIEFQIGER
ncbi:energy transducer TonB [Parvularcula marina]|uniref:TonB family protein n=1 Tax=Parvularcula marina TaxID=2292771 RepID=A0A371RK48_9PROT|nr:energy transducer TonB [Parvularcula marina]RFB05830.1 TonB family protein [Parvularcula marina]